MTYHVAIDIGASSGRVILATKDHFAQMQEIHRFKNSFRKKDGHDRWDMAHLLENILQGLEKVKQEGVTECTIGIDTWAVDYCLVDQEGNCLADPIAYRDKRTQGVMEKFFQHLDKETIYQKTGIQFLAFNTLYQLFSEDTTLLEKTSAILLIPDYIAYYLTGKMVAEVSNISTTQLLNLETREYDEELLKLIGLRRNQFPDLVEAGESIGYIREELMAQYDLPKAEIIAVATHDTASAVVGVPARFENWAYLSSGTWSLIGVENVQPITSSASFAANYTNEWGAYQTYRYLKNITGMWAVQEIARHLEYRYSFAEMAELASQVEPFLQYVNLNDERFINPENMIEEIQTACRESHQIVPETVGELVMCVYSNLALLYAHEWRQLETLIGRELEVLHIVGGGSNVTLLNQLTADVIGKPVVAGPDEATAIGNLLVQMISSNELVDIFQARHWLCEQENLKVYQPQLIVNRNHLEQFREKVL